MRASLACPVTQLRPCEHHSLALSHNSDLASITRLPCHTIPTLRASLACPVTQFRPCEHHSLALSHNSDHASITRRSGTTRAASITRLPCQSIPTLRASLACPVPQFRPCEHHSLALSHNSDLASITRLPCHTIPTLRASLACPVTQFRPCEHHSLALSHNSDLALFGEPTARR